MTSAKKNDPEKPTTERALFWALPIPTEIFPFSDLFKLLTRVMCKERSEGKDILVLVGTEMIIELSFFDTNRCFVIFLFPRSEH